MGPRELVLNPEVSAWRHPDGAVKANRLPPRCNDRRCSRLLLVEPLGVSFAGPAAAPLAAPLATGAPSFCALRGPRAASTTSPSSSPVQGLTPPEPRSATWRGLARARAVRTRRWA